MAMVTRFEDLVAWQRARDLTREIYLATRRGSVARDFGLARQIQRAAVSVMSNIAEGFERGNRNEFSQFLSIAKGSCGELRSQLYVALDVAHVDEAYFDILKGKAEEVSRITAGLRTAVAKQRTRRTKS